MTQGEIQAQFAAGKLTPSQAADLVIDARRRRTQERRSKHPVFFFCLLALSVVASALGIRRHDA